MLVDERLDLAADVLPERREPLSVELAGALVDLAEDHHTSAFWSRLERAMPYALRKQWLAEHGGQVGSY
jgi:hypothetical protein